VSTNWPHLFGACPRPNRAILTSSGHNSPDHSTVGSVLIWFPLAILCLSLLVGIVVRRAIPPINRPNSVELTKLCAVRIAKSVVVHNHSVTVPLLGSLNLRSWGGYWSGCGRRYWLSARSCWGWLRRNGCEWRVHSNSASRSYDINLRSEQNLTGRLVSWWNLRAFKRGTLHQLKLCANFAILPWRSTGINDSHKDDARSSILSYYLHGLDGNIRPVFKLLGASKFQPLNQIEHEYSKGQNAQDYLSAIIEPPSKTVFGYVLILFGLVINYFGFCAFYKGWYRRTHQLSRGMLGLVAGLGLIAGSVLILGQGYILAFF
jgi:hypothetical protein